MSTTSTVARRYVLNGYGKTHEPEVATLARALVDVDNNIVIQVNRDGSISFPQSGATVSGSTAITGSLTVTTTAAVTGAVTMGGTLGLTGNLAINTNKFNVTASNGNTAIAGTCAIVGATTLTGALGAGAATFSGNVATTGTTTLTGALSGGAASFSSTFAATGATTLGATTITATTPSITLNTGQTNTGFLSILGKTSGGLKFTTGDTGAYLITVTTTAQTTGTTTLTIPDFANVADTFSFVTLAQSLSNKTLVSPVISTGLTASGSAANTFAGSTGTFLTSSGANTLSGATTIADATTPSLTTAAGKTNTGFVLVNGKTSGGIKILPADTSGYAITVTNATQTTGTTTLTLPDFANVADTFAFVTLAQTLVAKTLTSPVINTPTIKELTEVVTATNVIAASETGSTFYLNNTTGFVSTLPAPAAGLKFTFINQTANTSGNHTVVTNSSSNIIKGNQNSVAGDAGDSGTGDDTINFVANASLAGDKVVVESDGTSWFAYAISRVAAGITFTTAS